MSHWTIEQTASGGRIQHHARPRFTACWTTGDAADELAALDGPCWTDEGSGSGEDTIHLYGFAWHDAAPQQEAFERLMTQAARAIDRWIVARC